MKKHILIILAVAAFTFSANAQLFQAKDVAKIADYVVSELDLKSSTAQQVKGIYADYGEQMRKVMQSMKPLNAKQKEIEQLTDDMDQATKKVLPQNKQSDYDLVTNHYRKRGINSSALNNDNSAKASTTNNQLEEAKEVGEKLKSEFKSQLGVNDAQADRLVGITLEHNIQKSIINKTYKANAVNRSQKMNELNKSTNDKVRNILNDQQYKKFLIILLKSGRENN